MELPARIGEPRRVREVLVEDLSCTEPPRFGGSGPVAEDEILERITKALEPGAAVFVREVGADAQAKPPRRIQDAEGLDKTTIASVVFVVPGAPARGAPAPGALARGAPTPGALAVVFFWLMSSMFTSLSSLVTETVVAFATSSLDRQIVALLVIILQLVLLLLLPLLAWDRLFGTLADRLPPRLAPVLRLPLTALRCAGRSEHFVGSVGSLAIGLLPRCHARLPDWVPGRSFSQLHFFVAQLVLWIVLVAVLARLAERVRHRAGAAWRELHSPTDAAERSGDA